MGNPLVYLAAGAVGLLAYFAHARVKKRIFVSYYAHEDGHYKKLLKAWSRNKRFRLDFEDASADVSIKSENTAYLRRVIRSRIVESDVFLVVIGKDTHKRDWVLWEIETAKELNKEIVVVKTKKCYRTPEGLKSCGATWVYGFNANKLHAALQELDT